MQSHPNTQSHPYTQSHPNTQSKLRHIAELKHLQIFTNMTMGSSLIILSHKQTKNMFTLMCRICCYKDKNLTWIMVQLGIGFL